MVSYFVSEQPTVERSLAAGPPGGWQYYYPCHLHGMSVQLAVLSQLAKYCPLHLYVCLPPGDKCYCSAGPRLLEPAGSDPEVVRQLYLRPWPVVKC